MRTRRQWHRRNVARPAIERCSAADCGSQQLCSPRCQTTAAIKWVQRLDSDDDDNGSGGDDTRLRCDPWHIRCVPQVLRELSFEAGMSTDQSARRPSRHDCTDMSRHEYECERAFESGQEHECECKYHQERERECECEREDGSDIYEFECACILTPTLAHTSSRTSSASMTAPTRSTTDIHVNSSTGTSSNMGIDANARTNTHTRLPMISCTLSRTRPRRRTRVLIRMRMPIRIPMRMLSQRLGPRQRPGPRLREAHNYG